MIRDNVYLGRNGYWDTWFQIDLIRIYMNDAYISIYEYGGAGYYEVPV